MRFVALVLLIGGATRAFAAPAAEAWPLWSAQGTLATPIDHSAWDAWLQRHVVAGTDGINRIAYARVDRAERAAVGDYLAALQAVPIRRHPRAAQRAFWINLYNAATVKVVLDHYPVDSILKISISPGLFARGPWKKKLLAVEGQPLSLDDVEHRILRPLWNDPRTHYAVNCASLGCPNLARRAWVPETMDAMLDEAARAYVNHPRGARVERGGLTVSSIYAWFEADFGGEAGVLRHLRRYAAPPLARELEAIESIDDDAYDWSLNDAS